MSFRLCNVRYAIVICVYHSMSYFFSFRDTSVERTYILFLATTAASLILNVAQRLQKIFNSVESDSIHVYGHVVLDHQFPGMEPVWFESSCRLCRPR